MAHLGPRVSALLDGQLGPAEEERAWAHVHACHACRDLVEREGWVKTQLFGLSMCTGDAPDALKGSLGDPHACADRLSRAPATGRRHGMLVLGSGAAGMAVLGVLALSAAPSGGPADQRRGPVTSVNTPATTPAAYRIGPHHARAGLAGVRMAP